MRLRFASASSSLRRGVRRRLNESEVGCVWKTWLGKGTKRSECRPCEWERKRMCVRSGSEMTEASNEGD